MNNPMMLKNHHHVVVTLTDTTKKSPQNAVDEKPYEHEVRVLDNRTLLLRMNRQPTARGQEPSMYYRHLEFDAVGYEYEMHIRAEITEMTDAMFKRKENCCMIRITPQRVANMNLLTRFLVTEVDKVMLALRLRLISISLEYYDVRKFDMVNLLAHQTTLAKNKAQNKEVVQENRILQSTRELFQWLLYDYTLLRGHGTGDDYIDVIFRFCDFEQRKHKVHLSLFQLYALTPEPRNDLMGFFKSIGTRKNPNATLITDCLKESFDLKAPTRTLLWFEVPLTTETEEWLKNMFKMADAAFVNISLARIALEQERAVEGLKKLEELDPRKSCKDLTITNKSQTNIIGDGAKNVIPPITPRFNIKTGVKSTRNITGGRHYSKDDYNSLSYWYNRIDEQMDEVYKAMDHYNGLMFGNRTKKICNEIKLIDGNEGDDNYLNTVDEEKAKEKYNKAFADFRGLDVDVEKSSFATTLKVYLTTKNYELLHAEELIKKKALEKLRTSVMDYMHAKTEGTTSQK